MPYWLAAPGERRTTSFIKRFDARFWTVDFPRPIMAAVTTTGSQAMRVDSVFYKADDLAGLIWASEDVADHPLLAYETSRDYRGCALKFRWQSSGIMPLDVINGPTLTIQGRDAAGVPKSWFVRLWNYASGTNNDALISLDFDALSGGFMFPDEADPVFAGDIDRMFISLVPPSYTGVDTPLAAPVDRMVVEADLVRLSEGGAIMPNADPGRGLIQNDAPHGATTLHLIDLPPIEAGIASMPHLVVAAAGVSTGWRRAALLQSIDGGVSWEEAGVTAAPAIIGAADTVLGVGSACLIDEANSVEVTLLNAAMTLGNADAAGLDAGRNLAVLGEELIQFRTALPLGNNRYRLSGLYRGRRGTQWAIAGHSVGERFILIERDALAAITVPPSLAQVMVMAVGIGDGATPPTQTLLEPGQALMPIAPAHLCGERLSDGRISLDWVRRSRDGWRWADSVDAPLAEEGERYRLTISPGVGAAEQVETTARVYLYTPPPGALSLTVSIVQVGTFGPSRAAMIIINLTSGA